MALQHINLDHPALHRQRVPFSLGQGALAAAVLLLASALLAAGLRHAAAREAQAAASLQAVAAARPLGLGLPAAPAASGVQPSPTLAANPAAAPAAAVAELEQLRQLEAGQRRVRQALASGAAGAREGYTELFVALARQAQPGLWITGFTVSADGNALALEGRMQQAEVLPAWLRKLNAEPRLKGRSFAQLQLRTVAELPDAPGPVTEFHLRSQAETAAPGGPP